MAENEQPSIPVADLVSRLVTVETGGMIPLGEALERIGYEMPFRLDKEHIAIWFRANRPVHSITPELDLKLSKDGLFTYASEDKKKPAKVMKIKVDDYNEAIEFIIQDTDNNKTSVVKLATKYTIDYKEA